MKKTMLMALAGGLMMMASGFTSTADAGYKHHYRVYKPVKVYTYSYSYTPYYYQQTCKWVYSHHYGKSFYKCW